MISPTLTKAILYWKSGRPAPIDLETQLLSEGFDLYKLEAKYRK